MSVAPLVAAFADDIPSADAAPAKAGAGSTAVNATAASVATTAARPIDEIMSFRANISNIPLAAARPSSDNRRADVRFPHSNPAGDGLKVKSTHQTFRFHPAEWSPPL